MFVPVFMARGLMKKSRFTESHIVAILNEAESGIAVKEVSSSLGISAVTFYKWRPKYGGLAASELTRDNRALKNLIEKKL